MTIRDAGEKLRAGQTSAVELARQSLLRIEELQPQLNAFITITGDLALEQAQRADDELARGHDRGPLHGIPYALKDCFTTKGIRTTCGSKIFAEYIPDYDSAVYIKLREAGAVLMGKTGLHELAYGTTSNNPHFGAIRNPHDPARIPGGSSGGSAVAVAAGMVIFAMGTDTGGSIRIPSAFCGCAGFKPTLGTIDTRGLMPLSVSQDHAGPMAGSAEDLALVMNAFTELGTTTVGTRLGLPSNFFNEGLSPVVAEAFAGAVRRAAEAGFQIVPVMVPDPRQINAVGRTILLREASALMKLHLHRRGDFGADVLALLDQGLQVTEAEYLEARRLRGVFQLEWDGVWDTCDFVLTPTVAIEAPLIGQNTVHGEDVRMASTKFVRPFNVLGLPACSVPVPSSGLPVGLQIIGRKNRDADLLAVAARLVDDSL